MEQPSQEHHISFYVSIYTLLSVLQMLSMLASNVIVATVSFTAAEKLHRSMLESVLRARLTFFHTNLIGRILNRFSKDQMDVDRSLAMSTSTFLRGVSQ
jgi:ATP-binding cassette subfamily C (CFTR/MRP) protein 1